MFERLRYGELPKERLQVPGEEATSRVYRRLEKLERVLADSSELHLSLPATSWVSVSGGKTDRLRAVLWVETVTEDEAAAMVEGAEFRQDGATFTVMVPGNPLIANVVYRWHIVVPRDRAVTLQGTKAFIAVADVAGPVTLSTELGYVSVIEASGPTKIRTMSNTHVVWAGRHGDVDIDAQSNVYLKLLDRTLDKNLRATSGDSIHLWVPRGFTAGIEAEVVRSAALRCRADLRAVHQRDGQDRVALTYVTTPPKIRLNSVHGSVHIDNYD